VISVRIADHSQAAQAAVSAAAWEAVRGATLLFYARLKAALAVVNPSSRRGGRTVYLQSAARGGSPRRRTGYLLLHVGYDLDRQAGRARVGLREGAKYGLYLDRGSHPWFGVTIRKHLAEARSLFGGGT
jgi:hypothetical protein